MFIVKIAKVIHPPFGHHGFDVMSAMGKQKSSSCITRVHQDTFMFSKACVDLKTVRTDNALRMAYYRG